jgi:adenylylsulfate kinase
MFTIWFMGLPSSGKSTLAKQVENELNRKGYNIENLDGDGLRQKLHPDLGFSKEDRRINNRRTAYISRLLNKNGIPTIVAQITPFRESQTQARDIIESESEFVMVYVKCDVEECKKRDPKGLYKKAEEGKIENFTGVNHPFQEPKNPEIIVETDKNSIEECKNHIMSQLEEMDLLDSLVEDDYGFELSVTEHKNIKEDLKEKGYLDE